MASKMAEITIVDRFAVIQFNIKVHSFGRK